MSNLEDDRKTLKANLDDCEHRNTKLELLKRSLEGDIQRTKTLLTDKETEVQVRMTQDFIRSPRSYFTENFGLLVF